MSYKMMKETLTFLESKNVNVKKISVGEFAVYAKHYRDGKEAGIY